MSSRLGVFSSAAAFLVFVAFHLTAVTTPGAPDVWDMPAFSASPEALRQAASAVKADKDADATVLLVDNRFAFDRDGKVVETFHSIYRIESEDGVKDWAETSGRWEPWHQSKPEIRARVITADGAVHTLDPKTLNDVPVHEDAPEVYSDQRAYGGPLPAVTVGAIVEEEIVIRDTAPFFAAGQAERLTMDRSVPVNKTRLVLSHPDSLPFRYLLRQMPGAQVQKSSENGIETITIEDGPYEARTELMTNLPPDVVPRREVEFSTGKSWQQLATAYAGMTSDKYRTADVQPLLAKLDLKNAPRSTAIRKIVLALHKTVRYTGVEFGESSLVPQFPSETLKRKYGDCKDKATLLVTMLRAAGIPASLSLLDTGPGQDINPELPGLGMFDHAIVYLPASGNDPEMWIDATAQYTQVGYLPLMDYGRWTLIVDDKTSELKKIPEIAASENLHRETREFKMAEFGNATIVETNEQIGPDEERMRDFYTGDAKQVRENSEKYVKNTYLADALISLDHSDLTDMEKPFKVTYVAKGKRGSTDLTSATMAIRQESIFDGLPSYFYEKEDQTESDTKKEDKPKPRTADWWIQPYATEWHYKITAPPGFKLRALPPDKEQPMGTARYTQKYTSSSEGTVAEAVFRFDSGKPRITAEEGRLLRDEIVKARQADAIFIVFDQVGFSLLSAGKIKEGLAAEQQLVALHPKEALHRVQLANLLLAAGMGERARAIAREATTLEPSSAQAFSMLGLVLEHDLIGRRFKKGFDYAGALAAYRKAKQLDPKDHDIRSHLAYLLEFNEDGLRYHSKSRLEEAAAEYKELKKIDEEEGRRFEDNVLFDLWYAGRFKDVAGYAATLPSNATRRSFILAATAAEQGVDAAIKKSLEITTEDQGRSEALSNAGFFMMRVQKYAEAAELLEASTRGQSKGAQLATMIAMLKKTRPYEALKIDSNDPSSGVQELFAEVFTEKPDPERIRKRVASKVLPPPVDLKEEEREFRRAMFDMRSTLESSGMPLRALGDIVLSSIRYTKEDDGEGGYRVTMNVPGSDPMDAFVVPEEGRYKLLEFSLAAPRPPEALGWEVLALLQHGKLATARKWLDWAREKVHINDGDDPLSGQPFPHFWSKGQEGDEAAIRTAALVLLPSKNLGPEQFAGLIQARDHAKEADRNRLNLVLAYGYAAQKKWTELAAIAEELVKAAPDSLTAYNFATRAYGQLKRFDDWDKLLQARLQKHSNDPDNIRSAALLARYRGDARKARELVKGLMDRGKATASDLNSYAWDALMLPGLMDQDSLDAAEHASQQTKNGNFAILHTLACLYAEAGKAAQAREVLLKAMDAAKMEEPESEVWFAYGKIAEQYGEIEAARTMYARVEKPDSEYPGSSYELAQKRLLALKKATSTTARNAE